MDWISVRSLPPADLARATVDGFWAHFKRCRFTEAAKVCEAPIDWFGAAYREDDWVQVMQGHHAQVAPQVHNLGQLDQAQLRHMHADTVVYCFGGVIRANEVVLFQRIEKSGARMAAAVVIAPRHERIVRFVDAERFRRALA